MMMDDETLQMYVEEATEHLGDIENDCPRGNEMPLARKPVVVAPAKAAGKRQKANPFLSKGTRFSYLTMKK